MPYPEIQRLLPALCCPMLLWMAFRLYVLGASGRLGRSSLSGIVPAAFCFVAACALGGLAALRPQKAPTEVISVPISAPDKPVSKDTAEQLVPLRPVDKVVFAVPSNPAPSPLSGALPAPLEGAIHSRRRILTDLAPPVEQAEPIRQAPNEKMPRTKPQMPKPAAPAQPPTPADDPVPTGPVDDISR